MEAVPRLPMLCFDLRVSNERVDFGTKLKQYIRNHYNEDPTLYAAGITGIESMRDEAIHPSRDVSGCSLLKRYYCQLHFMASRFPMRENEEASVPISWKSLFSNTVITKQDIWLEMTSILYNIGSLHTLLGSMDNRTTAEGMKMSCTHFQCAAWAYQHIKEEFMYSKSFGLSPVLMSFMCRLCLAQAQECILEKSMMDNRKSAITAKVAAQVVEYYKQSLKLLGDWPQDENNPSEITSLKVYKKWEKYVQFKIAYYGSISLLFQGLQSEDQQKMGERVAFFQAAYGKLEEARKQPPGIENTENIVDALSFVRDVIEAKRMSSQKENEFVYYEEVPNISHLPEIKGASLVKGIPFNINDPEVSGPDLFSSIVPMKAHEWSSMYSEEKAKLLRRINGMIESKDEELETFLSMLDLDEIRSRMNENKLPQELIDRCASLSAKPDAIQNLNEAMNKLSDIYHDVESMLNEIKALLAEEESHEKEYQEKMGKRPPSIAATDLTREAKKYLEGHAKASESNQTLHKAMVKHVANLKLLSLPLKELLNHIPAVTESPEVETVSNEIRHIISKVEEMKQQRLMLAGQLRDLVCQDDITRQVITFTGDKIEDLFEQELKKYDKTVSLIEQNLAAQENILRAMKDVYARYGATRKNTGELYRRRAAVISSLIASYDAYEDLITKSSKGLDFYKKLETNVSKLLQRVKGTCKVQDEEREQMLKSVKKTDVTAPLPEVPSSGNLKLKDYLNMKKETGKLTLEYPNNVPPVSTYYDPNIPQQNWIPGIRPAPVGSEETETNLKGVSDSFRGFYQGQGKDQVWSNALYTNPSTTEQKLKYYLPQNSSTYQAYPKTSSYPSNQDVYPISSYSTVLPKTDNDRYEPKSNYYDTHGSPNRYYNPAQASVPQPSYNDVSATSAGTVPTYDPGYTSTAAYSQNPEIPYYGYSGQTPAATYVPSQSTVAQHSGYSTPSVQSNTSINAYPATAQSQATYAQVSSPYNPSLSQTYPGQPYTSAPSSISDPVQTPYSTAYGTPQASTGYSGYTANQTVPYISTPDPSVPTYGVNYPTTYPPASQTPVVTSQTPGYAAPQDLSYQSVPSYQPSGVSTENQPINYQPSQINQTSFGDVVTSYPQTSEPTAYAQQYSEVPQSSWQGSYNPSPSHSQQYFQSGNESLYTASHTPNNYAMTNSGVYKAAEGQTYSVNPNYGDQYYTSQYGAYAGQADFSSQNGNPVTYMQAGTDKQQAVTTTTFSNSEAKSSPVTNPSNVDLLAGLDFNISHSPLVPETTSKKEEPSTEVKPKTPAKTLPETSPKVNPSKQPTQEKVPPKDLQVTMENVTHFAQEVEKYEKFVEGLTLKTLNGPTSLDLKWKEIVDTQEKISPQHIISVARCYPMKNRFPDILPYDDSRVELPSTKDDYINASKMQDLTSLTPPFILTQAPLPSTYSDFWAMVFEQQVEVIVCLMSDSELEGHIYWPVEKSQELEMGKLKISLQSSNVRAHWIERILSISVLETRATRVVVHLQFTAWPGSSFPDSPGPFLSFSSECVNFFIQQRSYSHPVVVHCISGVGRTGLFCLIIASMLEIQSGKGIPDLAALAGRMCQFRKSCLRDREHLKFAYQAILYFSQDFLMKRGILTSRSTFEDKKSKDGKCHTRHPSEDFLIPSNTDSSQIQSGMERMEIGKKPDSDNKVVTGNGRSQSVCSSMSCTSSGRSSPASLPPDVLSSLDSANFTLKVDPNDKSQKKKKFTAENFAKGSTMDGSNPSSDDPLSKLDPLWTMKK